MECWVVQDDLGSIYQFSREPKRTLLSYANRHVWYAENCIAIELNNDFNTERYISEKDKHVEHRYLADILGFKRKGYKKGILMYEGISMTKPRKVDIEFNLKFI